MKRVFFVILLINLFILTGCSKEKYFTCKIDLENKNEDYKLNAEYKIYYNNSYVTRVEKKEIYNSNNEDVLEYFNEYKNLEYDNLNSLYSGVTYNVELKDNEIILNANLDMSLMDISKMLKDGYIDRNYVVSNKITTGGIKYIYKEKGAICDI